MDEHPERSAIPTVDFVNRIARYGDSIFQPFQVIVIRISYNTDTIAVAICFFLVRFIKYHSALCLFFEGFCVLVQFAGLFFEDTGRVPEFSD